MNKTTKQEYIKEHPKSYLAKRLQSNNWPDNIEMQIISGIVSPDNKNSNLYKALAKSNLKEWEVGGHLMRGPDGFQMAVA